MGEKVEVKVKKLWLRVKSQWSKFKGLQVCYRCKE